MMDWLEAIVALAFLFCFVMFCSHVIIWAMP
jgi:hypothetical protein